MPPLMASAIADVTAWQALDSRGRPTVACRVSLHGGAVGEALVPSGASTGRHEATELRDGGTTYGGLGVGRAVGHACSTLRDAVVGVDALDQEAVDARLIAAAGGGRLSSVGANAILGVSLAVARAAAAARQVPLYRWLGGYNEPLLPLPMVNILSGGAHAGRAVDVQDYLAVPVGAGSFSQAIEWAWQVREAAAAILSRRGGPGHLVADEGGVAVSTGDNEEPLRILTQAISVAGFRPGHDVAIAIDVAATQLGGDDGYRLEAERRTLTSADLVAMLAEWCRKWPVVSVEDPVGEDDWEGWARATSVLPVQLIGDDLFATQLDRLEYGIGRGVASAILVKPNQNGTLDGTVRVLDRARAAGYATVVSARSGDTEDAFIADLAVGLRAGQIKVGSTTRSERTAKWNRLLAIEHESAGRCEYAGGAALASTAARNGR